jgi:hypothetical protein
MAQAYVPIQTVTVGSGGAAGIEFTNIPQTYTDLLIKISSRGTNAGTAVAYQISFNSNTSNFSSRILGGNGSSVSSYSDQPRRIGLTSAAGATASTFGNGEIYIPNYAGSNNKSYSADAVSENNATAAEAHIFAGLWSNTAAITSVTLTPQFDNFAQYSTATLYGIGGAKASGGTITADAKYTYHTFTSTGTFTALEKIKGAEVLVIAGGAGGGKDSYVAAGQRAGGGGGAGGVVYSSGQTFIAGTSYSAIVGSGGAAGVATTQTGTNGSNSLFSSLTAAVGGGGGAGHGTATQTNPASGGSGGGGSNSQNGASGTAGQGFAGGSGGNVSGGGGGGAGEAGQNGIAGTSSGNGGNGTVTYSSWGYATSTGQSSGGMYYYAGGGGGGGYGTNTIPTAGAGGLGGGGAGATNGTATSGTANTGGGGGASSGTAGSGGSGLVIIRYPN